VKKQMKQERMLLPMVRFGVSKRALFLLVRRVH
jgi:hypothetical protein